MYNIIVRATDRMKAAFVRNNYKSKAEAMVDIKNIAAMLPKSVVGKREMIINYETEYRESGFDLSACVEITGTLPRDCGIGAKTVSFSEDVASLVCKEDEIEGAYLALNRHINEFGYKITGAYCEIYHDDGPVELKVPVSKGVDKSAYLVNSNEIRFEDDPEVLGKWEMLDIVPTREHFVYGRPKCSHLAWLNEIYFVDGGQSYWAVEGWSKGVLFTKGDSPETKYTNRYTLENADGRGLMFLEMYDNCDGGKGGCGCRKSGFMKKSTSGTMLHRRSSEKPTTSTFRLQMTSRFSESGKQWTLCWRRKSSNRTDRTSRRRICLFLKLNSRKTACTSPPQKREAML